MSIGDYAFAGCSDLTSVISHIKEPFTINSTTFTPGRGKLYVPKGTGVAYVRAGWTLDIFKGGIYEMEATGVEDIYDSSEDVDDARAGIFDLLGRKLDAAPRGGLYIQNGKKVLVK